MIQEKMLELLLLNEVLSEYYYNYARNRIRLNGKEYDRDKLCERYNTLMEEFLSPYVIDNDSKE